MFDCSLLKRKLGMHHVGRSLVFRNTSEQIQRANKIKSKDEGSRTKLPGMSLSTVASNLLSRASLVSFSS
jgi:hypothetical protein